MVRNNRKGKTYIEIYGPEKAKEILKKKSESLCGRQLTEIHKQNVSNGMKRAYNSGLKMGYQKGHRINLGRKTTEETKKKIGAKNKIARKNYFAKGNHPWNYIDGRSKLLGPARYGDDWDKIRHLIYRRDRFICQDCGVWGIRLDIHHKIPFLISRDNSINNLITLCRSCHMKAEKKINNELNIMGKTNFG